MHPYWIDAEFANAQCGSHAGACAHRRKHEPLCPACEVAEHAYLTDWPGRMRNIQDIQVPLPEVESAYIPCHAYGYSLFREDSGSTFPSPLPSHRADEA